MQRIDRGLYRGSHGCSIILCLSCTLGKSWTDDRFNLTPFWLQVWNVPIHWSSIDTRRRVGSSLREVLDVLLIEAGGREERHLKIKVNLDLTKPLQKGTNLK